ncbi:unnamed protein product [Hydatigera taeniaeformis]|uniref:Uncharacterized protein n=1 Tax=Hydatigena taeniaeformis TaxID=6205 RepID=A0A0R3WYR1_HYDTA|nr:unnamed protein product [Hydatigera taeniaeformis]
MHPIFTPSKWTTNASNIEQQEKQEDGDSESAGALANAGRDQMPPELEHFERIPFPDAVEQQFEETLCHLQMKPSTIRSLEEAEALVQSVERRYTQRMVQLMQSYGLNPPKGSSRTGVMETISEEAPKGLNQFHHRSSVANVSFVNEETGEKGSFQRLVWKGMNSFPNATEAT